MLKYGKSKIFPGLFWGKVFHLNRHSQAGSDLSHDLNCDLNRDLSRLVF